MYWYRCNPLAGIEVFHTEMTLDEYITKFEICCNPLAGIEVFHTWEKGGVDYGVVSV